MKNRKILSLLLNSIIALNVSIIAIIGIMHGAGDGQLGDYVIGFGYIKPFTMDSNILTGIVALISVVFGIKNLHGDGPLLPKWVMNAYLMAATSLVLTFLIVATFLSPIKVMSGKSYFVMFSNDMFFFHFLNPILATINLTVLLREDKFSFTDSFLGMLPTVVYSIVYFVMVVILKYWDDFYHFTFGGKYYFIPAVVAVIYGIAFGGSYLLVRLHNRFANN